jgi:hypothetical protein
MLAGVQTSHPRALFAGGLILAISFPAAFAAPASPYESTPPTPKPRILGSYGNLPLSFEANSGQVDKSVKFLARGSGYGLFLKRNEVELVLCKTASGAAQSHFPRKLSSNGQSAVCDVVRMQLAGASNKVESLGEEQLPGRVNYFIDSDSAKWHSNVPTYAKVRYPGVYPDIDLLYYGNQRQIEFDFVVAPSADPGSIWLRFNR